MWGWLLEYWELASIMYCSLFEGAKPEGYKIGCGEEIVGSLLCPYVFVVDLSDGRRNTTDHINLHKFQMILNDPPTHYSSTQIRLKSHSKKKKTPHSDSSEPLMPRVSVS